MLLRLLDGTGRKLVLHLLLEKQTFIGEGMYSTQLDQSSLMAIKQSFCVAWEHSLLGRAILIAHLGQFKSGCLQHAIKHIRNIW